MQFVDNYPLKNITTLQIGGPTKKFVTVSKKEELKEVIQFAKQNQMNHLVIGGGSNLLISDLGFDGLIIKNEIKGITREGNKIAVHSGTVLQELVDYTIQHGLEGLHKMTGIPGTMGGAVFGNAGAYGQTISDHIVSVKTLNPNNSTIQQFNNSECGFNYRDSIFKRNGLIILEVTFELPLFEPSILADEAKEVLQKRLIKYPPGIKCPGSFFKNIVAQNLPPEILQKISPEKITYGKISAGYLLEAVGANGQSLNDIYIAAHHANLFVNKGGGSAQAFYDLAKKYAELVKQKFGITLEPEVQLINLPPLS